MRSNTCTCSNACSDLRRILYTIQYMMMYSALLYCTVYTNVQYSPKLPLVSRQYIIQYHTDNIQITVPVYGYRVAPFTFSPGKNAASHARYVAKDFAKHGIE